MRFLWTLIRSFLVFIGLLVVTIVALVAFAVRDHLEAPTLPDRMVLAYTLNGTPADAPAAPAWMVNFGGAEPTLPEVTAAITRAAADERVTSLAVQLGAGNYDWADVQELQEAIATFKAADKKTYVFAESYGDLYPGMAEYYLASVFDEIWMQPMGTVAITGFAAEAPYFSKTLERLGIKPEITQRGEYKTAPESMLREHMSDQQRETLHGILSSMTTDFFDGVSKSRDLPAGRIGQLIDGAPYTADEAKERNLIDVVGYQDQLMQKISPDDAGDELVNLIDYYDGTGDDLMKTVSATQLADSKKKGAKNNGKSVALIYITGMIIPGTADMAGPFGDKTAWANDIAWDITEAANDPDVGVVVLRVDSPGGSPSASETIRRAVEVAREKGKYVIVSMGSEAASGGYWVSVDADKIYAQPGTLTGSIGVFGGKPDLSEMWGKLDVNWDSVELGANAGMWSPNRPYDVEGQAAVGRMMDNIYDGFIDRVATGRNFSEDVVEEMAGGRVWTGRQAKERGLIDEIGGLNVVLDVAAAHMGVSRADLDIYVLPEQPNPLHEVFGFLGGSVKVFNEIKPLIGVLAREANPEWGLVYHRNALQ